MSTDQNCLKAILTQLQRDEGSVKNAAGLHTAYRCPAGKLTIGYGRNLDAAPLPGVTEGSLLTEEEAVRVLTDDVKRVWRALCARLPWFSSLDGPRMAVLVNMAFNMGVEGLLGFRHTLHDVRTGDFAGAARRMLVSRWACQVGERARRLARQMETGTWQ